MTRTTVRLPDALLEDAKTHARRSGRTLTQLIEDGVRAELTRANVERVRESSPRYGGFASADARAADAANSTQLAEALADRVGEIQAYVRRLPRRDGRTDDEILGFDAFGLPT